MVIAGYIPANSQLAAAIATIEKVQVLANKLHELMTGLKFFYQSEKF